MKKLLCFLWTAGCWYLAAMYRSLPLLVLGVCGAGLLVCAFLTPYFLAGKVQVSFSKDLFFLRRGQKGGGDGNGGKPGPAALGKGDLPVPASGKEEAEEKSPFPGCPAGRPWPSRYPPMFADFTR